VEKRGLEKDVKIEDFQVLPLAGLCEKLANQPTKQTNKKLANQRKNSENPFNLFYHFVLKPTAAQGNRQPSCIFISRINIKNLTPHSPMQLVSHACNSL